MGQKKGLTWVPAGNSDSPDVRALGLMLWDFRMSGSG